jgi:hypothetical protein
MTAWLSPPAFSRTDRRLKSCMRNRTAPMSHMNALKDANHSIR